MINTYNMCKVEQRIKIQLGIEDWILQRKYVMELVSITYAKANFSTLLR
jgi:hypothetical protein